jgi:hypothetical protein
MAELLTAYLSLRLQAVDACVIALAERLDLHEVAALDPPGLSGGRATSSAQRAAAQAAAGRLNPRICKKRLLRGPV